MVWVSERLVPSLVGVACLAVAASNAPAGMAFRTMAGLPLRDLQLLTQKQYESFALDGYVIELPAPYGMTK